MFSLDNCSVPDTVLGRGAIALNVKQKVSHVLTGDAVLCCAKSLGRVWLCNPMDCSPPGSPVHGILQARIRELVALPSSRGSSRSRDGTQVSQADSLPSKPPGKPLVWGYNYRKTSVSEWCKCCEEAKLGERGREGGWLLHQGRECLSAKPFGKALCSVHAGDLSAFSPLKPGLPLPWNFPSSCSLFQWLCPSAHSCSSFFLLRKMFVDLRLWSPGGKESCLPRLCFATRAGGGGRGGEEETSMSTLC